MAQPHTGRSDLGERIRNRRKELRLSQRELAEKVHVGFPHLSKIENGAETPSDDLLRRMAVVLEDDVDELMALARRVDPELVELVVDSDTTRVFLRMVQNGDISMEAVEKLISRRRA